mmetsp:Transcript_4614/g.14959  ORF Transcript_4614/g.14959 Transcript_4614/m.14959 type:complete len:219 (-) Transcript_4614:164-820(-)
MNSVFICVTASCSLFFLVPRKESISSMKMIDGCNFHAKVKTAVTSFCASPNHFDCNVLVRTLMKHACDSFANAFASSVFPVPGGPYNSTPFAGFNKFDFENNSGRTNGNITSSCSASFVSSNPPMELNVTLIWSGFATSAAIASSYTFVTNLGRPKRLAISFFLCSAAFEVCLFGSKRFNPKERTKQLNSAETARKATSWRNEGGSAGPPRLFDILFD